MADYSKYIKTSAGLPNTCSVSGRLVTEGYWYAPNVDQARAGQGVCEEVYKGGGEREVPHPQQDHLPGTDQAVETGSVEAIGLSDAQADALREAGFGTYDALEAASDEDLLAVEGIGQKAVDIIRKQLTGAG
jgi:DNA-directed RNA polymerase alpha subunit